MLTTARRESRQPAGEASAPTTAKVRHVAASANPIWSALACGHVVQAKLRIGASNDPLEQEADRVADRVADTVTRRDSPLAVGGATGARVVQRASIGRHDEAHRPPDGAGYLNRLEGRGRPLPSGIRRELEPRFGRSFSDVRVHTDGDAADSARSFNALAYTYDRHVVFGAGQFDAESAGGQRLIAHELAHVVQQSRSSAPAAVQRKGPPEFPLDPCVSVEDHQVCGSDAVKACSKIPSLPGCGTVCKLFDCPKPPKPTASCPPRWTATTSKGFEGQCCLGTTASAQACCPPDRIAFKEAGSGRCCVEGEVVVDGRCVKLDIPSLPLCLPPSKPNLLGQCCTPPQVPKGTICGLPDEPKPEPKPVPKPKPAPPVLPPIFFKLDRPSIGEGVKSFDKATTKEGKTNFDALVKVLTDDPSLKVHLVGRASPEGDEKYNDSLGGRRAEMVAEALEGAGISRSRIADAPGLELGAGCASVGSGMSSCGKTGAKGPRDRQVQLSLFAGD